MKVSSIRWGVIWIGVGLFFLAINFELLDSLAFPRLFSLWPVLLVAIGVELIFRRTKLYFLALLSPLLIAATFVLAASARGQWGWHADEFWRGWGWHYRETKTDVVEIPADTAVQSLDLLLECGPERISLAPASNILFKSMSDYYRRSPWVKHSVTGTTERIEFLAREKPRFAFFGPSAKSLETSFEIADYVPLKIAITTTDDEPSLDFTDLRLSSLDLDVRAARTTIAVGRLNDKVDITISGKTLEMDLTLPQDFGLAVVGDQDKLRRPLEHSDLKAGADGYYSPDFDAAAGRVRVMLGANVKSISISRN